MRPDDLTSKERHHSLKWLVGPIIMAYEYDIYFNKVIPDTIAAVRDKLYQQS
ncbi:MAG: hypothetical protein M1518_02595 [Candidatus Thermoplasmatota archaeon]|jgi:hypothetical protein|nr:hypothetical protein [Candidatus Thermoplasmatota archaeon]